MTNAENKGGKTIRKAAQTAAFMALLTLGMKLLGFLREVFMAGFFGTSYITDAYVMASNIPGILFAGVFTSVAISYMPIFSQINEREGQEKANRFTAEAITLVSAIALVFAIVGIIFSDQIVTIFAHGYTGERAELTSFYLKITFFYIVFSAAASLFEANLQYKGTFLKTMLTGYLQSIFVLLAIIISAYFGHYFLAWGLLVGSAVKLLALMVISKERGFEYRPTRHVGDAAKKIVALAIPVFVGSTVNQVNSFVDKMLASGLSVGSVSALNYGYLLTNMITALTITIIVTIIYPRLTQAKATDDNWSFNDSISKGTYITVIIGLPCSLGAMLYSKDAVRLVYERGAFNAASTDLTSDTFFYYAIGLTFIAVNALLVKVFYALQDMRSPVICGIIGAVTNVGLSLLLVGSMQHKGLALGTSIAAIVNSLFLYIMLRRTHPEVRVIRSMKKMCKIVGVCFVSIGLSYLVYLPLRGEGSLRTIIALGAAVAVAGISYLVFLKIAKVEELDLLRGIVRRK
ncbi:MAG: murein biosynthesis integral membrane protein MurJ [Eubacteriales bacterium]|nr:murein biosynthesis integral membrane protein MurJ [Eubacteriales bacterium]MDD3350258.1 murein biosynthesis integral membrane protein MurJ [Eubacteriales bacterium]